MHDEMLERRLRDALHAEGDSLGLTITSAELERRLAMRRRARSTRTFGLLLAAALSIGAVGAAAVAGGFFDQDRPSPGPSQLALVSPSGLSRPSESVRSSGVDGPAQPASLPTLAELLARDGSTGVVIAQGRGPDDAIVIPETAVAYPSTIDLPLDAGDYRLTFGCITRPGVVDAAGLGIQNRTSTDDPPRTLPCDGTITTVAASASGPSIVRIVAAPRSSWRVVVRTANGKPIASSPQRSPTPAAPEESLVEVSGGPVDTQTPLRVGSVPFRRTYHGLASCNGGASISWLLGESDSAGNVVPETTVIVPCDGGLHEADLTFGELHPGDVFVTPAAGASWNLIVTGESSPLASSLDSPEWTASTSNGGTFNPAELAWSFSGDIPSDQSQIRVVVSCEGAGSVDVVVTPGQESDPPVQSWNVRCVDQLTTTVPTEVTLPGHTYLVETQPHGQMWIEAAVQQRVTASSAP